MGRSLFVAWGLGKRIRALQGLVLGQDRLTDRFCLAVRSTCASKGMKPSWGQIEALQAMCYFGVRMKTHHDSKRVINQSFYWENYFKCFFVRAPIGENSFLSLIFGSVTFWQVVRNGWFWGGFV